MAATTVTQETKESLEREINLLEITIANIRTSKGEGLPLLEKNQAKLLQLKTKYFINYVDLKNGFTAEDIEIEKGIINSLGGNITNMKREPTSPKDSLDQQPEDHSFAFIDYEPSVDEEADIQAKTKLTKAQQKEKRKEQREAVLNSVSSLLGVTASSGSFNTRFHNVFRTVCYMYDYEMNINALTDTTEQALVSLSELIVNPASVADSILIEKRVTESLAQSTPPEITTMPPNFSKDTTTDQNIDKAVSTVKGMDVHDFHLSKNDEAKRRIDGALQAIQYIRKKIELPIIVNYDDLILMLENTEDLGEVAGKLFCYI